MSIQDCKRTALADLLGITATTIDDMEMLWLLELLGMPATPALHINDLWDLVLTQAGYVDGTLNDRQYDFLTIGMEYPQRQINDLWYQFWCVDGGVVGPRGYSLDWITNPITELNENDCSFTFHFPTEYLGGTYEVVVSGEGGDDILRDGILTAPTGDFIVGALDCSEYARGSVNAAIRVIFDGDTGAWYNRAVAKIARIPLIAYDFSDYPAATDLIDIPGWSGVGPGYFAVDVEGDLASYSSTETAFLNDVVIDPFNVGIAGQVSYISTGATYAGFPVALGFDSDNFLGIRYYANQIQFYERIGGVWGLLFDGGSQAIGDIVGFMVEDGVPSLYQNGVLLWSGSITIDLTGAQPAIISRTGTGKRLAGYAVWDLREDTGELVVNGNFTGAWLEDDVPEGNSLVGVTIPGVSFLTADDVNNRIGMDSMTGLPIGIGQAILDNPGDYDYEINVESVASGGVALSAAANLVFLIPGIHSGTFVVEDTPIINLTTAFNEAVNSSAIVNSWSIKEVDPDELIINPNFFGTFSGTGVPQGNNLYGSAEPGVTYLEGDEVNHRLRIVSNGDLIGIDQEDIVESGVSYDYIIDVESVVLGGLSLSIGGEQVTVDTPGVHSGTVVGGSSHNFARMLRESGGGCDITINGWSIKLTEV